MPIHRTVLALLLAVATATAAPPDRAGIAAPSPMAEAATSTVRAAAAGAWVTSLYETTTGRKVSRDCGYSSALPADPARAIWVFCDTAIHAPSGEIVGFIGGSTAAAGPIQAGQAPTGLTELPTPPAPPAGSGTRAPAGFLPAPANLVLPGGTTPCGATGSGSYAASWISGLTRGPNRNVNGLAGGNLLFLSYLNVCVANGAWTTQSYGVTFYDPAANRLVGSATVFPRPAQGELSWQRRLGSPTFADDGYLYLFASTCAQAAYGACGSGSVTLARAAWRDTAGWSTPAGYQYWTGSAWTGDPGAAASVLPGARPFSADARPYPGRGWVLVEQTTIAGHYRLWRAANPTGPWTAGAETVLPGCASTVSGWCYAFIGHPELSTSAGLSLSYYQPDDQHVQVAVVSW